MASLPNWWDQVIESGHVPDEADAPADWWAQAQASSYPCETEQEWGHGLATVMNTAALIERLSV